MEWLLNLPAYVKVGSSFAGILLLYRLKTPLGVAILLFSALLTLWTGAGRQGLSFQLHSFTLPQNFLLPVIILMLLFFSDALHDEGNAARRAEGADRFIGDMGFVKGFPGQVPDLGKDTRHIMSRDFFSTDFK